MNKKLNELINEKIADIQLTEVKPFTHVLNEDDFGGDDDGGDPFGGDDDGDDPFAGDEGPGGDDEESGDANGNSEDTNEETEDDAEKTLDLSEYEDDPDFTFGIENPNDVTILNTPAGKTIYDVDNVMNATASLLSTLTVEQLAEYSKVKRCVEIIFNGKKLKDEDLDFSNIQNATFLIEEISKKLDIKTAAYLSRKIKEPLILKRDKIKQDMADQQTELQNARDVIIKLDSFKPVQK